MLLLRIHKEQKFFFQVLKKEKDTYKRRVTYFLFKVSISFRQDGVTFMHENFM